jgi:hypothetical protein
LKAGQLHRRIIRRRGQPEQAIVGRDLFRRFSRRATRTFDNMPKTNQGIVERIPNYRVSATRTKQQVNLP